MNNVAEILKHKCIDEESYIIDIVPVELRDLKEIGMSIKKTWFLKLKSTLKEKFKKEISEIIGNEEGISLRFLSNSIFIQSSGSGKVFAMFVAKKSLHKNFKGTIEDFISYLDKIKCNTVKLKIVQYNITNQLKLKL